MAVRSIAGSIFVLAVVATSSASAEDTIKSGNWEFSVTAAGVTQLPSGVQLSPDMRPGPEGLTRTRTRCVTAADPFPAMLDSGNVCKTDKSAVSGGTLRWSVTCVTPKTTVHEDWVAHYHGETMDGEFTLRSTMADHPPVERKQQLSGRYLGPCPDK
jgi:hypothetical protein